MPKAQGNPVSNIDANRFDNEVLTSDMPVAVLFHTDDVMASTVFSTLFDRVAQEWSDRMRFVRVDRQLNRDLADRFDIRSSPTLLFFRDGQEACARKSGYIELPDLVGSIETLLGHTCPEKPMHQVTCDVLILGAGPAGMTAAIYAARSRLYTIVLEKSVPGGQVATTFHIANYPGVNGVVRGMDLMEAMKTQALSFGTEIHDMLRIVSADISGTFKRVLTDTVEYRARSLIIATGAEPRKLPVPQEKAYRSRGIHYCATCDGALYQDMEVLVVGGGVSALEEAEFLTRYARRVTIINRSDRFRASKGIVDHVLGLPGLEVRYRTQVTSVSGDVLMEAATLKNLDTGEEKTFSADGVFVYIGSEPDTALFGEALGVSAAGFIVAGEDMKTNVPGVFAAGDIRDKPIRQITTAVSDGTIAAIMAERFLAG